MTAFSLKGDIMKGLARAIEVISIGMVLYLITGAGALIVKEKALAYYSNCSQLAFVIGGGIILLGLFWLSGRDILLFAKTANFVGGPFLLSAVLALIFSGRATFIPPQYFIVFVIPGSIAALGWLEITNQKKLRKRE